MADLNEELKTIKVPILKGGASIEVILDDIPDSMYQLAVAEGLKVLLNKRMSKIGAVTKLEGDDKAKANAAAMEIAEKNLSDLKAGALKSGTSSTSSAKVAGVVMTEARRLAKDVVKNRIRAAGMKVSHVEASEITKVANELLKVDPSFIEQATANIEARKAKASPEAETDEDRAKARDALNALGGIAESPKLRAKSEKEKAERKTQLSAKQAGMTKVPPAKKAPEHHTAH